MIDTYPRETVEYVRFANVAVDGVATINYQYAVVLEGERPTTWSAPTDMGNGVRGFLLTANNLGPGLWTVWVKVDSSSEHVVILAGRFLVD